jgi:hypothetical protein
MCCDKLLENDDTDINVVLLLWVVIDCRQKLVGEFCRPCRTFCERIIDVAENMGMSCKLMEPLKEEYCSSKSAAGAGYCERVVHYLATLLVTANNSCHNK